MHNNLINAHLKHSGENMKIKLKILSIVLVACLFFPCLNSNKAFANNSVYLGGMPAGFSLYTKGAQIIGICDVVTENGLISPLKDTEIKEGDVILKINGQEISNAHDIKNSLDSNGNAIIEYQHKQDIFVKEIKAVKDINGQYKLGIYIRDCVSGIGTITFIKGKQFASLGHPVINNDGTILNITGGNLYDCYITGYIKGVRGHAGELKGTFTKKNPVATIDKNIECGVYGIINDNFSTKNLVEIDVGKPCVGDAIIYSTIDGNLAKKYSISIIKVDNTFENKNLVVKITDKELISKTGGIVPGMSGSPIVQNNKLVGAITHVFINDPTRGFGISISNMINNW